jgi:hypothetical protein
VKIWETLVKIWEREQHPLEGTTRSSGPNPAGGLISHQWAREMAPQCLIPQGA